MEMCEVWCAVVRLGRSGSSVVKDDLNQGARVQSSQGARVQCRTGARVQSSRGARVQYRMGARVQSSKMKIHDWLREAERAQERGKEG